VGPPPSSINEKACAIRRLSLGYVQQTLPNGNPLRSFLQQYGSYQRSPRLAHLRRLCPHLDSHSSPIVRRQFLRHRIGSSRLGFRLDHDRTVSLSFPSGKIPKAQSCHLAPYASGSGRSIFVLVVILKTIGN